MTSRALYQEVILDHNRKPRNFGALEGANRHAEGKNPLCGDHVMVDLIVEGDCIRDVHFTGQGCAISKASASLMTQAVKGKSRAEAQHLFERFHALVTGREAPPAGGLRGELGPLAALAGVSRFPIRVKCASLAWHTLHAALSDTAPAPVSTE